MQRWCAGDRTANGRARVPFRRNGTETSPFLCLLLYISMEEAGFLLGGAGGGIRPPLEASCPPLGIATTHMHNVYVHVEVSPVSMAKLSKSDILLIFNQ